ncbi:unnamed protein product [Arabidopsis arenosa]|uniref:DUF4283 domain-containing protein n=1 Tax=Arabidopsis arenosa TaxID=38785 RepID=A0A8S2A2R0_ARAAE|nr:unnamed protein product [Arabidopsis arenosa]
MSELASSVSPPGDSSPVQSKQLSYAAAVNKRPSLKKHEFQVSLVDGIPTIEVPSAVISDSVPLWEDFLVGRFPSTAPHVAKIHVIVNKIWSLGDKTVRIDVYENNTTSVKFRIRDQATRLRVLRRGMWNIAGLPMILAKWSPIPEEAQPEVSTMPLWVTLKNVPHSMYSWEGLGFLSSPIGDPIRLHPETELCSNFEEAKVFVGVNLTKSLPQKFCFKLNQVEEVTVEFVYPWLPPRRSRCSKWGHTEDVCVTKKASPVKVKADDLEEGELVAENDSEKTETSVPVEVQEVQTPTLAVSNAVQQNRAAETHEEQDNITQGADKDGWSLVSPGKGCKSNEKVQSSLAYGQVTILSASRFSVLDNIEEPKLDDAVIEGEVAEGKESLDKNVENGVNTHASSTQAITEVEKASSVRATRQTKNSQKATSESFSQQAKARPSVSSKRTSK